MWQQTLRYLFPVSQHYCGIDELLPYFARLAADFDEIEAKGSKMWRSGLNCYGSWGLAQRTIPPPKFYV